MNAPLPDRSQLQIARELFSLAWPIIGINVLQVAALAVDTAMVGRLPEAEAGLTGLGYAGQIAFLLMVAMIGLTVGTIALVARAHGSGHDERVDHIFHQSTQLTIALGIAVAVVGNATAVPILWILGADEPAMEAGLAYLRPLLLGTAFNYLNILFAAILRGLGNTRLAFQVALLMNGLNVVINYALILGNWGFPSLGLTGAAIGTVLSQGIAAATMFALLRRGAIRGLRPTLELRPLDRALAGKLFAIGWPAALDMVVFNASFLSIIGMLGRIDQAAVAAHAIGLRVQALAFVPGMSISQATGALVGQALGAGHPREARRVLRASVVMSLAVMTTLTAILVGLAEPVIAVFGVDPSSDLGQFAVTWLKLLGYGMPIAGAYISFVGLFQGAGQTRAPLAINSVAHLVFQVPLSWILGFPLGLGAWGVWAAFPLSFVLKLAAGFVVYRTGRWAKVGADV